MEKLHIKVILASIRPNRFGIHPATLLMDVASKRDDMTVELLDLKDYRLPDFESPISPAYVKDASYGRADVDAWAAKIAEADGFVIVTPEYNHGYPAPLKNAIDHIYKEWNNKAVAYVGYGGTGGARVITQLRSVATEQQMAPIRSSVHIMFPWMLTEADGSLKPGALDDKMKPMSAMLDQLTWWAAALRSARQKG